MDKLFPPPPGNRYKNLMIDNDSVSYITTPYNSEIISTIIQYHIPNDVLASDLTIFDATAGVGGDTIALAKVFKTVLSCEINQDRFMMLKNNVSIYNLYNVIPLNRDSLDIMHNINFVDVVYFDPPWGGSDYKSQSRLKLSLGGEDIESVVNNLFDRKKTKSNIKLVALKLPNNYDIKYLYEKTKNDNIIMYLYQLKKITLILYQKKEFI